MSCGPRRAAGRPLGSSGAAADCSCAWGLSTLPREASLIMPFASQCRANCADAAMCEHLPISGGAGAPHLYEFPLMGTWLPRLVRRHVRSWRKPTPHSKAHPLVDRLNVV